MTPTIGRVACFTAVLPALLVAALSGCATAPAPAPAPVSHYPTPERVVFVQACLRDHPGGYYEMLNKCSCAIDAIARELSFEDYTSMSTATNANSIGGERGSYIRDAEGLQGDIRKFRQLTAKAKKGCFINLP
jgi:hypothetical protein